MTPLDGGKSLARVWLLWILNFLLLGFFVLLVLFAAGVIPHSSSSSSSSNNNIGNSNGNGMSSPPDRDPLPCWVIALFFSWQSVTLTVAVGLCIWGSSAWEFAVWTQRLLYLGSFTLMCVVASGAVDTSNCCSTPELALVLFWATAPLVTGAFWLVLMACER